MASNNSGSVKSLKQLKVKILHIDNSVQTTGAFKALMNLITELGETGSYESIVAISKNSLCNKLLERANIPYTRFKFTELRKSLTRLIIYPPVLLCNVIKMVRYVRKNNIAILHNNDHFNLVPVFAKAWLGRKVKLLVHVRLLNSTYNAALYGIFKNLNLRFADKIIGVSEAVHKAYGGTSKMVVISDRIDITEKHGEYMIREKPEPFRFLYLSNYIPGKGQNFALQAYIQLAGKYSAELHFYGGDMGLPKNAAFKKNLINQAHERGLNDRIKFCSFSDDIEKTYKNYDASLCFSESESFSLVCVESMFYGLPIIATDCGGPAEIIENNKSGVLVENRNVAQMAAAMEAMITDNEKRVCLSREGRKRVLQIIKTPGSFTSELNNLIK